MLPELPPAYLSMMESLLGGQYVAFREVYTRQPAQSFRLNIIKTDRLEFSSRWKNLDLHKIAWCPSGFSIRGEVNLGKHPDHAAGLYYLQDASAMAVAEILDPRPGERVLDLSAAPGGKTTHLAALMGNQGLLVANEIHPRRVWELAENLERCGVTNTAVLNETPQRLAAHFGAWFDRVLVDAPCSGEGMFRKSEAARRDWSPALVQSCAARQMAILNEAVKLVRPGGWLAYSTCTFNPQENEGVISRLLCEHPEFELVEVKRRDGFSPGRPDWLPGGQAELARSVRIWPHLAPGEGHFVALLQKKNTFTPMISDHVRNHWKRIDPSSVRLLETFRQPALRINLDAERLVKIGSYLYYLPARLPDLAGLKIIHPGWWLGTLKKDRFEPAHALAMGLKIAGARQTLDFSAGSAEIAAYLRGETLTSAGGDGWVLVCVDRHPLGWGKRSRGVVKNYYPHGLRWAR